MLDRNDDLLLIPFRMALRERPQGQAPVDALRGLVEKLREQKHSFVGIDRQSVDWWWVVAASQELLAAFGIFRHGGPVEVELGKLQATERVFLRASGFEQLGADVCLVRGRIQLNDGQKHAAVLDLAVAGALIQRASVRRIQIHPDPLFIVTTKLHAKG